MPISLSPSRRSPSANAWPVRSRPALARVVERLDAAGDDIDPREEARESLEGVAVGFERGELDLLTAGLLRQQILAGQRAWLEGRRVRAEARIDAALAHEDSALLP